MPKHLYERNTFKALLYVFRDIFCAVVVYRFGWMIDPFSKALVENYGLSSHAGTIVKWALWALYWHTQGVILAGWWCLAHEAGHGSLSNHSWVNHLIGYSMHTVSPCLFLNSSFLSQPHSSSWFPIMPGALPTMPTTRLPCPSSATRTMFPERVPTTTFPLRQAPTFPTIMKSSKRLPSTVFSGCSSCKLLVGNTIFLPTPWDLRCIQLVPTSVFCFLAY